MKNFYDYIKDKVKFCGKVCNLHECAYADHDIEFGNVISCDICNLFKKELKSINDGCISYIERTKKCIQYFGE